MVSCASLTNISLILSFPPLTQLQNLFTLRSTLLLLFSTSSLIPVLLKHSASNLRLLHYCFCASECISQDSLTLFGFLHYNFFLSFDLITFLVKQHYLFTHSLPYPQSSSLICNLLQHSPSILH